MPSQSICTIPACSAKALARGWCPKHYMRWRTHGTTADPEVRQYIPQDPAQRFWQKVNKSSDCWVYTGACKWGYGAFWLNGKQVLAHRFSWELLNGPIPNGMLICHHCDNPPCVRPEHLFLGTSQDNRTDAVIKGRHAKGERIHFAKLAPSQITEIRDLRNRGLEAKDLAVIYEVDKTHIWRITRKKAWKHL